MGQQSESGTADVVLIGAGIMSGTFDTVLKELEPSLKVVMFETLHDADACRKTRADTASILKLDYV